MESLGDDVVSGGDAALGAPPAAEAEITDDEDRWAKTDLEIGPVTRTHRGLLNSVRGDKYGYRDRPALLLEGHL